MKKLQTLLAAAVCGVVFTAVGASAQTAGYGTVVRTEGSASYSLGDNVWYPLVAGKKLPVGAIVRTGHNGTVDIVLGKGNNVAAPQASVKPTRITLAPDSPVRGMIGYNSSVEQNVVRLTPDTTLGIDKLTVTETGADSVSDTELNLKQGKIYASVKKLTGASQYLIKLPNGIAGVRGTMFSISVDGTIAVFESTNGGVALSLVQPDGTTKTYLVAPGQLLDPASGQPAVIPAELIQALKQIFDTVKMMFPGDVNFSSDFTQLYVSPTQGN